MTGKEYLQHYNIQPTEERVIIVEHLMKHHTHPTGDEVFVEIIKEGHSVSRATVFNTLKALTERKALHALPIEDGVTRYDIELHAHAHFRCERCGKIIDIPLKRGASFDLPEGCRVDTTDYILSGICQECEKSISDK